MIDRHADAALLDRRLMEHVAIADGDISVGRYHVNVVRLERDPVLDLDHGHRRALAEQARHHAFALRIEVQHQHEGDAAVARHGIQERLARLQPAGRGADADDGTSAGSRFPARLRTRTLLVLQAAVALSAVVRLTHDVMLASW